MNAQRCRALFWQGVLFGTLCIVMALWCVTDGASLGCFVNFAVGIFFYCFAWRIQSNFHKLRRIGGDR